MFKNIFLLFLISCASFFSTQSDLHLFFGSNRDYFKYDSMKSNVHVRFYTKLLQNNLTFNVANQMQAKEVFKKVNYKAFKEFEDTEEYGGVVLMIKTLIDFYDRKEIEEHIQSLSKKNISFRIAELNEVFRQAIEKEGYWQKIYFLNILGRFAEAPSPNYKVFIRGFDDLVEAKRISEKELMDIGKSIITNAKKDKYMNFHVVDLAFAYNIQRKAYGEKCKSKECKDLSKKQKSMRSIADNRAKAKDDKLVSLIEFTEKNAQLIKDDRAFIKELKSNTSFRAKFEALVEPLWWE